MPTQIPRFSFLINISRTKKQGILCPWKQLLLSFLGWTTSLVYNTSPEGGQEAAMRDEYGACTGVWGWNVCPRDYETLKQNKIEIQVGREQVEGETWPFPSHSQWLEYGFL